eukprot:scaffold1691_cov107-Isochrysis_galbana.AAC.15
MSIGSSTASLSSSLASSSPPISSQPTLPSPEAVTSISASIVRTSCGSPPRYGVGPPRVLAEESLALSGLDTKPRGACCRSPPARPDPSSDAPFSASATTDTPLLARLVLGGIDLDGTPAPEEGRIPSRANAPPVLFALRAPPPL